MKKLSSRLAKMFRFSCKSCSPPSIGQSQFSAASHRRIVVDAQVLGRDQTSVLGSRMLRLDGAGFCEMFGVVFWFTDSLKGCGVSGYQTFAVMAAALQKWSFIFYFAKMFRVSCKSWNHFLRRIQFRMALRSILVKPSVTRFAVASAVALGLRRVSHDVQTSEP